MKTVILLITAALAQAFRREAPHPLPWVPPGPTDARAPCPMLNTLANHGFLPHDGKNITEQQTISALGHALNIDAALAKALHIGGVTTNPAPNATTFSLDDLSRHGIIEHDASLSRQDTYFGDNHDFNQTIFDQTRSYWPHALIDVTDAATARQARANNSLATNPAYSLTGSSLQLSYGESAWYLIIIGNKSAGIANRTLVEYLFENERLPLELGWTRPQQNVTLDDLSSMLERIANVTGGTSRELAKRGGLHVGRHG
ncbi:peroxidase [Aspergillus ellipticus CBS 707.79]|uniref:Peroxidase n=1 Tax=Aspergillus ellipticus CBS 707.79 TaxID=1448320 RepID=A0A319CR84_9EURO|nr:peroxidase [Aspergillus ellipticus CBS 707.79]